MKHITPHDAYFRVAMNRPEKDLHSLEKTGALDYIYTTLSYIVEAGEMPDKEGFKEIIKTGLSEVDEVKVMTLAEQYRQEGILQGMAMGKMEGKMEAFKAIILAMDLIAQKVNLGEISQRTGLSVAELMTLIRTVH